MTGRAFVIGHPIAHSRSPLIHGTWLTAYGIDGSYEAFDVAPDALAGFFQRIREGEFLGGNVTIPHKQAVFDLCDEVDELAEKIGAVNTVVREGKKLFGSNTDYMGFLGNLDQNAPGWSDRQPTALVLGAGGAARAILVALQNRNIPVILLNRTRETADRLASELGGEVKHISSTVSSFYAEIDNAFNSLVEFENGGVGMLLTNWVTGRRTFSAEIYSKNFSAFAEPDDKAVYYADGDEKGEELLATDAAGSTEEHVKLGFFGESRHFMDCIKTGEQPKTNFADAVKTMELVDRIYQSAM